MGTSLRSAVAVCLATAALAAGATTAFAQEATPRGSVSETPGQPAFLDLRNGADFDPGRFLGRKRLVVVFADNPCDEDFIRQMKLLQKDPGALSARDVVVIADTNPKKPSPLRERLHPDGFGLVLLGKDGRIGLRAPAPRRLGDITRAIDAAHETAAPPAPAPQGAPSGDGG